MKYSERIETILDTDVKVVFNIPSKEEVGYSKLTLDTIVVLKTQTDRDGLCKIVCDFTDKGMSESMLMGYVYERQKELIYELKKMVKLH